MYNVRRRNRQIVDIHEFNCGFATVRYCWFGPLILYITGVRQVPRQNDRVISNVRKTGYPILILNKPTKVIFSRINPWRNRLIFVVP